MSKTTKNVEQMDEQIVNLQPIVPESLKGTDGTWSWMTEEQRKAAFTSQHKNITIEKVEDAWAITHSRSGVAKMLGCSRPNAVRWLIKAGLIQPTESQSNKFAPKKGKVAALQEELAATKAQLEAMQAASGVN